MTDAEFWALIDETRKGHECDVKAHHNALVDRLSKLPLSDLVDFQGHLYVHEREAYRADLWGAGFVINGGCSDDGFEYFIGWVISRGEQAFRAAIANPDSLAAVTDQEDVEFEWIYYAASYAHTKATGKDDFWEQVPRPSRKILQGDPSAWDDGHGDMDEEKCQRLYPRLWKKFCAG